jgi:hypothetical protein
VTVTARPSDTTDIDADLASGIARLNGTILAVVLGLMSGLVVFIATIWLVIKGGPRVGPHLALLGQFFPGYSVTFVGGLAGLAWGAAFGAAVGWAVAWLYNRLASRVR